MRDKNGGGKAPCIIGTARDELKRLGRLGVRGSAVCEIKLNERASMLDNPVVAGRWLRTGSCAVCVVERQAKLQAQRLEAFEGGAIDNDTIRVAACTDRCPALDVVLLAAALTAVPAGPPGPTSNKKHLAAPPARLSGRGLVAIA